MIRFTGSPIEIIGDDLLRSYSSVNGSDSKGTSLNIISFVIHAKLLLVGNVRLKLHKLDSFS